ncbi:hypothetical protein [Streptomyces sp. WAC 06725]|nr:hypothetical protein [Streptomyces sp. WAC 06725]
MSPRRPARLAAFLIRRYLHTCTLGSDRRPIPLATGPFAALDETRRKPHS